MSAVEKKAVYSVTNSAKGARGVGSILVDAGASIEVEMTETEALLLGDFDDVEVKEAKPAPKSKDTKN